MRDAAAYRALLGEILRDKYQLFGDVAVRRARGIPGLTVGDDGRVLQLEGDPVAVLEAVLATFERLSGRASTISARNAVWRLRLRERFPDLELPAALR